MLIAIVTMTSCKEMKITADSQSPQVTTIRNEVKDFEAIEIYGSVNVVYQQANTYHVSVKAPQSLLKNVETSVTDKRLKIRIKTPNTFFNVGNSDDVTVTVSSPDLVGIFLKGSGDFKCNGHIDTDNMMIDLRGSGDIDLQSLICDNLKVVLSGSGDIDLPNVTARNTNLSLIGSGDIDITQHQVIATRMDLKGSGDIELKAVDCGTIESQVIGSGDINIEGTAQRERHDVKGSGDVYTNKLVLR